ELVALELVVVHHSDRESVLGQSLESADEWPEHFLPGRPVLSAGALRACSAKWTAAQRSGWLAAKYGDVSRPRSNAASSASSGVFPGAGSWLPSRLCSSTSMLAMQPKVSRLPAAARAWFSFGTPLTQMYGGRPSAESLSTVQPTAWRTWLSGRARSGLS